MSISRQQRRYLVKLVAPLSVKSRAKRLEREAIAEAKRQLAWDAKHAKTSASVKLDISRESLLGSGYDT